MVIRVSDKTQNYSKVTKLLVKPSYLSCDKIVACGGSWMVKGDLVAEGKFDEIKSLVEEAVELVAKIRGK